VEFEYRYHGSSAVDSSARSTHMSFAPDTKREPTYFRGELQQSLEFREAISALNAVVVSDMTGFFRWAGLEAVEKLGCGESSAA